MTMIKTWSEKLGARTLLTSVTLKDKEQLHVNSRLKGSYLSEIVELSLFLEARVVKVVTLGYEYVCDYTDSGSPRYARDESGNRIKRQTETIVSYYPLENVASFSIRGD